MSESTFQVRMMYKGELALAYGVSVKFINSMLKATRAHLKKEHKKDVFGEYSGKRLLTIKQIEMVVEHNGQPN